MRIFFATDLHGSDICFRKFLSARSFYSADVLVLGGDYTGKAIVPIVSGPDGLRTHLFSRPYLLRSEQEIEAFEQRARNTGYYPLRVTQEQFHELAHNELYKEQCESRLIREQLEKWIMLAEARTPATARIFVCPGNDDPLQTDGLFQSSPAFEWIERRVARLPGGYSLVGFGGSNPTPWNTHREYSERDIAAGLSLLEVDDWSRVICNIHAPPFDSGLDLCPDLGDDLRMRSAPGEVAVKPIGSSAIRAFLESRAPLLALCGHVHEARGRAQVGRTTCINPGSTYYEGTLSGVLIDLRNGRIHSMQFTNG